MKHLCLILFANLVIVRVLCAQMAVLDSLEQELQYASGEERIKILQSLSDFYLDNSLNQSIEYANEALRIGDELGIDYYNANLFGQLGEAYFYMDDEVTAEKYFKKVLEIRLAQDKPELLASALNNLGIVLRYQEKYAEALDSYNKALEINRQLGDTLATANLLNNMGVLNEYLGNYDLALEQYQEALKLEEITNDMEGIATGWLNIGALYGITGKPEMAIQYCLRSVGMSDSLGLAVILEMSYEELYKNHKRLENYAEALMYNEMFNQLKNSRINEDNLQQVAELEVQYESAQKEKAILELNKEKTRQKWLIYIMVGGIFGLSVIIFLVIRVNRTKKRANDALQKLNAEILQQKEEIEAQRDELETKSVIITQQRDLATTQRDQIARQNQDITDSIQYARKIQTATLPSRDLFRETFSDYFIINRPRDIVSGDFYWMVRRNNAVVFTVADCTGHGVPGALMSVLGISLLNEIVGNIRTLSASVILDLLRIRIIQALHQSTQEQRTRDGIEMALCVYHPDEMQLQYAGSYNSLFLVRDKELTEQKANRMPIGIYHNHVGKFTNHRIQLNKADRLFLTTDGYVDQMGGNSERKFLKANFKKLLVNTANLPINEQETAIDQTFLDWKKDLRQIDDILVLGVEI